MTVRATAMQGPTIVLITLYLWIRASDLIFDAPPSSIHRVRVPQDHKAVRETVRADSAVVGFEK
jgi:hypothetical protein